MKRETLIACSVLAGFLNTGALAQQPLNTPGWGMRAEAGVGMWPRRAAPLQDLAPVPRGDLRGDIANNARMRFEPGQRHGEGPIRH